MIPKSVSVSTRIVALAVVLFLPVWGWAGETADQTLPLNHCSMSDGKGGELLYACDKPPQVVCYQRMRDAMRLMDRVYYNTPMIDLPKMDLSRRLNAIWMKTMKDCVEGR